METGRSAAPPLVLQRLARVIGPVLVATNLSNAEDDEEDDEERDESESADQAQGIRREEGIQVGDRVRHGFPMRDIRQVSFASLFDLRSSPTRSMIQVLVQEPEG